MLVRNPCITKERPCTMVLIVQSYSSKKLSESQMQAYYRRGILLSCACIIEYFKYIDIDIITF